LFPSLSKLEACQRIAHIASLLSWVFQVLTAGCAVCNSPCRTSEANDCPSEANNHTMGVSTSKPHPIESKWFPEFEEKLPSLEGKTVAITGCTSGTGLVVAKTCVKKQAKNVLMLNRSSDRATKAEEEVKTLVKDGQDTHVETIPCDLQDFESVREAARTIKSKYEAVDVLCNNAGVMALDDIATKDGYDVQSQTNHLSHFLLTKELFPLLKRAGELRGEARIVHHSSMARMGPPLEAKYFEKNGGNLGGDGNSVFFGGAKWKRYHQTKLANTVMTVELAKRLEGTSTGIKAAVAAPGLAATNLQVTTAQTGGMSGSSMWIMRMAQSAEDGSMPILAACFDPSTSSGDMWEPSLRGKMVGPAVKVKHDKNSLDPEQGKMLWEKSEAAVGKFEIS
jgi:NAD(P)-dependent dehydrogenase (short-subunit alcohol dehydrogenase family)